MSLTPARLQNLLIYVLTAMALLWARILGLSWLTQGAVSRPSGSKPAIKSSTIESHFFRPVSHRLRASIVGKPDIATSVSALLGLGSPSAVIWRVRAVVVDSLDAVLRRWSRAHVSVEGLKDLPALADFDAAPAVSSVVSVGWAFAARTHSYPNAVLGRAIHAMASSLVADTSGRQIIGQTPARLDLTTTQPCAGGDVPLTAVTLANPLQVTTAALGVLPKNNQSPESHARVEWDTIPMHRDVSRTRNRGAVSPAVDAARGLCVAPIVPSTRSRA